MNARAIGLITLSYFRVFPGMGALLAIGAVCMAGALATTDDNQRWAWAAAAGCFAVAVPALFAGLHFRNLATRRTHALLPGFSGGMLISIVALFILLALLSTAILAAAAGGSFATGWALAFAAWSGLFWYGFLPTPVRAICGFALIAAIIALPAMRLGLQAALSSALWPALIAAAVGWVAFARWFLRRMASYQTFARVDQTHWNLPMGLNWGPETVGSPAGTLLLGTSDAPRARALRAAFGALGVPLALVAVLYLTVPAEQAQRSIGDPVLSFLSLAYALGYYTHLAQQAAQRRTLLWLLGPWDWSGLRAFAERVMLREWLGIAVAVAVFNGVLWAASWASFELLALSVVWLLALLLHLQLALYPLLSERTRVAAIFAHLLALTLALAAVRIGANPDALSGFAVVQICIIAALRLHSIRLLH